MIDINNIVTSLTEVQNISYHLQVQDERDKKSLYLMGIEEKQESIGYKKPHELPVVTMDKTWLSWSGRNAVRLRTVCFI